MERKSVTSTWPRLWMTRHRSTFGCCGPCIRFHRSRQNVPRDLLDGPILPPRTSQAWTCSRQSRPSSTGSLPQARSKGLYLPVINGQWYAYPCKERAGWLMAQKTAAYAALVAAVGVRDPKSCRFARNIGPRKTEKPEISPGPCLRSPERGFSVQHAVSLFGVIWTG